jgi:sn-glycerol 3-phosphate transport system permease protein
VFFYWPASQALYQSMLREDPFGLNSKFVWFDNFSRVLADPNYVNSVKVTAVFSVATAVLAMGVALLLAVMADKVIRGRGIYRTLMIWPYAVAPAIAGMLWLFLFNPSIGTLAYMLRSLGVDWNPLLNSQHAMILVVTAAAWKQISYNFLFFVAGLQAIPKTLIEAAAIDGAGETKRFWTIVFPLLAPTTFFLLVVNTVYAFFDTFGIIHAVTGGGPGKATETLVYKVYNDGFVNLILGDSAAQSVILMVIVIGLTAFQFRFVEKKVHYG